MINALLGLCCLRHESTNLVVIHVSNRIHAATTLGEALLTHLFEWLWTSFERQGAGQVGDNGLLLATLHQVSESTPRHAVRLPEKMV